MTVGFAEGLVHDSSRTDWDGAGPRPISWAAWYPADADAIEAPMRAGGPGEPLFDIGAVAHDVAIAASESRMPVVLVSHGTGGTAASMGWLACALAERGYVVLAASHHGNTAIEPYRAEGFLCWWERARDLSVLLDHLMTEVRFAGCLDPDRVFAIGFSLGVTRLWRSSAPLPTWNGSLTGRSRPEGRWLAARASSPILPIGSQGSWPKANRCKPHGHAALNLVGMHA